MGRRITFGANANEPATEIEIVGVARDTKYTTLREAESVTIYLPAPQMLDGVANYGVRRFVESILFGITAADPLTYAVVAGVLIAITLIASLRPAHRAARVDPMTALRAE